MVWGEAGRGEGRGMVGGCDLGLKGFSSPGVGGEECFKKNKKKDIGFSLCGF